MAGEYPFRVGLHFIVMTVTIITTVTLPVSMGFTVTVPMWNYNDRHSIVTVADAEEMA
jgi:hypothetical protein